MGGGGAGGNNNFGGWETTVSQHLNVAIGTDPNRPVQPRSKPSKALECYYKGIPGTWNTQYVYCCVPLKRNQGFHAACYLLCTWQHIARQHPHKSSSIRTPFGRTLLLVLALVLGAPAASLPTIALHQHPARGVPRMTKTLVPGR